MPNTEELLNYLNDSPPITIDLLEASSYWLDSSMKVYFIGGTMMYFIQCMKNTLISSKIAGPIGAAWNGIDAIGAFVEAGMVWRDASTHMRQDKEWEEKTYASILALSSAIMVAGTVIRYGCC